MFQYTFKIFYEDTDAGGVVYYANYLKYLERARTEALSTIGLSNTKIKNDLMRYELVAEDLSGDTLFVEVSATKKTNLDKLRKLPMSEGLMLAMTQKGLTREKAYKIVQRNAMKVWKSDLDFETVLDTDNELKKYLNKKEISKILDLKHATRRTDYIFKKVFK